MFLSKDDKLKTSPVYFGYLILKELEHNGDSKVTILDIVDRLKSEFELVHYPQVLFAVLFLFQSGLVDFHEPYLCLRND